MSGLSLYVHVPFCAARCPYCDFATAPAASALRGRYLAALALELRREGRALGRPRIRTLYVGGGTPSLLEAGEVALVAEALRSAFELRPREATLEANPATLDGPRLAAWRDLGITRVSIGAQSFSERGLRALGRAHRPEDVAPVVALARAAGCRVSLDLIFGWPGQSPAEWRADLDAAVALAPDHLSCYPLDLALEPEEAVANWPGGGWAVRERWRRRAAAGQPDDAGIARLYALAQRGLAAAGYRHYEIANWARPGRASLHNLTYWRNGQWLGAGAGAHTHLAGARSRNPGGIRAYCERVEAGLGRSGDPAADEAIDTAMLALRLDGGLDLGRYRHRFGAAAATSVGATLRSLDGRALLRWSGPRVRLTPRGRILANEVFVRLLPD
ncbi:MAG TPA: radical SAM family heme chaperone HemW [Candidatus Limnocylindrales bacterium]|nr:radical SAM family heme chaperone HemW [Candidatus Limnocylindrales bacterium]